MPLSVLRFEEAVLSTLGVVIENEDGFVENTYQERGRSGLHTEHGEKDYR